MASHTVNTLNYMLAVINMKSVRQNKQILFQAECSLVWNVSNVAKGLANLLVNDTKYQRLDHVDFRDVVQM